MISLHLLFCTDNSYYVPTCAVTGCVVLRYQHHPKLVAALNKFALTDCELPDKWEKRLDKNGRVRYSCLQLFCYHSCLCTPQAIFINHSNRSTSFVDPRLPYPGNNLKSSSTIKNWVNTVGIRMFI